jgi:hypothetical protein
MRVYGLLNHQLPLWSLWMVSFSSLILSTSSFLAVSFPNMNPYLLPPTPTTKSRKFSSIISAHTNRKFLCQRILLKYTPVSEDLLELSSLPNDWSNYTQSIKTLDWEREREREENEIGEEEVEGRNLMKQHRNPRKCKTGESDEDTNIREVMIIMRCCCCRVCMGKQEWER